MELPARLRLALKHPPAGVKTNVVAAIRILDKDSPDSPEFSPLVKETVRNFTISEVSADKAYTSLEHSEQIAGFGGTAYLPFKSNTTGAVGGLFAKLNATSATLATAGPRMLTATPAKSPTKSRTAARAAMAIRLGMSWS